MFAMNNTVLFILLVVGLLFISTTDARRYWLYIGAGGCDTDDPTCKNPTPTDMSTLYIAEFESTTGSMTLRSKITGLSPDWLRVHPSNKYLFAVSPKGVSSFLIDPSTGGLTLISDASSPGGVVFMDVHPLGTHLFVASYGRGTIGVLSVNDADGTIGGVTSTFQFQGHGPNPVRQDAPHPHSINVDPKSFGRFVLIPDLGLDTVFSFEVREGVFHNTSYTNATKLAPGGGPRHMAFHPRLPLAYVLLEMGSAINVLPLNSFTGSMPVPPLQIVSTLPANFTGFNKAAEVIVHPLGEWLFASNRGYTAPSNSITVYSIDRLGLLKEQGRYPSGGSFPRGVVLSPEGDILIAGGQDSNNVVSFAFDRLTGVLTPTGSQLSGIATPVAFAFVPAGPM